MTTKALVNAALVALLSSAALAAAAPLPADRLYATLSPSIWKVVSLNDEGKPLMSGSAVVIGPETLLTNCHVLRGAKRMFVTQDNVSILAQLQYADPVRDMCQLVARNLKAPAVRLGNSDGVVVGQRIYTIGSPLGLELTLSDGLISALRRNERGSLIYIQISAAISHGSSGGGLFDEEGRLIGITSASLEKGQNLNLAIPIKWQQDLARRSTAAYESASPALAKADLPPANGVPSAHPEVIAAPEPPQSQAPAAALARMSPPFVHATPVVASGFARLDDVDKVVTVSANAGKAYGEFLEHRLPRAFAVATGGKGHYSAQGTRPKDPTADPDPAVRVVPQCEAFYKRKCMLYAVDEAVVYQPVVAPAK